MTTEEARDDAWRAYSSWDGQYHTTGYRGALDAGFDAGIRQAEAERYNLARLHEVATERAAAIRIIVSDWQLGAFSSRHFGAHQAMTQIVAALGQGDA